MLSMRTQLIAGGNYRSKALLQNNASGYDSDEVDSFMLISAWTSTTPCIIDK